jgi:hypothetical protein
MVSVSIWFAFRANCWFCLVWAGQSKFRWKWMKGYELKMKKEEEGWTTGLGEGKMVWRRGSAIDD